MDSGVRHIITDIEGTTSAISFVHEVLFPYARARIREFVFECAERPEVAEQLRAVRDELGGDAGLDEIADALERWIDEDRKATPLKALQGMIWQHGYAGGELRGHVYDDVPEVLAAWHRDGIGLWVYSSGSEQAQRLLFGHSVAGDLTPLFSGYFDTRIGHKRGPESYRRIADRIGAAPQACLFLSDVGAELDAAAAAGMRTCQLLRDATAVPAPGHPQARDFHEVDRLLRDGSRDS